MSNPAALITGVTGQDGAYPAAEERGGSRPFLRCVSALQRDFVHTCTNVFSIDNAMFTKG